jgi:transposase-like protein
MKTFKNLLEAQLFFKDEKTCWKYWEKTRWNGNPVCPHCASVSKPYKFKDGKTYQCSDKDCTKKFTAIVGTIFENTKLPLQKWFLAAYLVTAHKKGISSLQLSRDIGVTQKTAWFVLHRLREMLKDVAPQVLEGTVEVDETYVGGKEGNKHQSEKAKVKRLALRKDGKGTQGRGSDKTMVLGLVQRNGNIIHKVIPRAQANAIIPVIEKHVKKGSNMVTDEFQAYNSLRSLGYKHETVSHVYNEYVRGQWHSNTIEGAFGLLKRGIIGIYHYVSPKHLQRYCDEFAYRYNSRKITDNERFNQCFTQAEGKRLTYKNLIKKV